MKNNLQKTDPTFPHIEFIEITPSEFQTEDQSKMICRLRITLAGLPPFQIEGHPKEWRQLLRENLRYLQKQYPESFSQANQDEVQLFSDKYIQEQLVQIEQIRQMALSDLLFE